MEQSRTRIPTTLLCALLSAGIAGAAPRIELDFSRDPVRSGLELVGPGVESRMDWDRHDPPAWPGDTRGSLRVHHDALLPTVRAELPLGFSLDGSEPFRLEADLVIESLDASPEDFHSLGFGLGNTTTTGGNRTGTAPHFGDTDVYDYIEASYFPNVTPFGGPVLTPTVFGGDIGTGDAFWNFASIFGPASDLGDNGPGQIRELPVGVPLRVSLDYDACTQTLRLEVADLSSGGPLTLETGLVPLDLSFLLATEAFEVDAILLPAFEDRADFDPSTPSLFSVTRYHRLSLEVPSLEGRATPRRWRAGRGGDVVLHLSAAVMSPVASIYGTELPLTRVDTSGRVWKLDGEAFEALVAPQVAGGDLVEIIVAAGCQRHSLFLEWGD